MSVNSGSGCPINKLSSGGVHLIRNFVEGLKERVSRVLPDLEPYTSRFGLEHLRMKNLRSEMNVLSKELDIGSIYLDILSGGVQVLENMPLEEKFTLQKYCESEVSIGITRTLIREGKNIEVSPLKKSYSEGLNDILPHLFSIINDGLYEIAIKYIEDLKTGGSTKEAKALKICLAFGELEGVKGLPSEMKELIFTSGITNTIVNIVEMLGLKIDYEGFDKGLLGGLIDDNKDYWNGIAKSNIPMDYIMKGHGYMGVGDFDSNSGDTQKVDQSQGLYGFEAGTMRLKYLFSKGKFKAFVKKGEKGFMGKVPKVFVGCPLLYEKDESSGTNMILAYQNIILDKILEGLGMYYQAQEVQ